MADNLPVIKTNQELTGVKPTSSTLLGRGLAAIQNRKSALILLVENQDEIYQLARLSFNLLTDYGYRNCFAGECWQDDELEQLLSCFDSFKNLADTGYGKAYYPLYHLFQGGPSTRRDEAFADHYAKMAFDWCFDNQFSSDPEIWNDLGTLYRLSAGCEMDLELAMYWYRQAADAGNAEGMFNVSGMYEFGVGVEEDLETAHYWQVMAAEAGHALAQYQLAYQFHHGGDLYEQNDEIAFNWYLASAVRGYENAVYGVQEFSTFGFDLPQDNCDSLSWFRKKGHEDNLWAQLFLAKTYYSGLGIDCDISEAMYWYFRAANLGSADAQNQIGEIFKSGNELIHQNYDETLKWFRLAAEQDHVIAQCNLGLMYSAGNGVEVDYSQAAFWLTKAAAHGSCNAQIHLGVIHRRGKGVTQDLNKALDLFKCAAEQGSCLGQICFEGGLAELAGDDPRLRFNLALRYLFGLEVEQDEKEAVVYFSDLAEEGFADAQYYLALCYEEGRGQIQDYEKAIFWYRNAAKQEHVDAQTKLTAFDIDWMEE